VTEALRSSLGQPVDPATIVRDVLAMRRRLEDSAPANDLKRGTGGLADIEFIVQILALREADGTPLFVRPNVWEAIEQFKRAGSLTRAAAAELRSSYDFLRTVESRLRIVHNRTTSVLPDDPDDLARLARRTGYVEGDNAAIVAAFRDDLAGHVTRTRGWFEALIGPVRDDRSSRTG
jgi:glutamate-ammonia-ligase adenylyltransferase